MELVEAFPTKRAHFLKLSKDTSTYLALEITYQARVVTKNSALLASVTTFTIYYFTTTLLLLYYY